MANTLPYIIQARDQFSKTLSHLKEQVKKANDQFKKLDKTIDKTGKKMSEVGGKMVTRFAVPFVGALGVMVNNAAKLETMETAFLGILGSAEKAKDMVKDLNEFTAKTPFQLDQVATSAKKLLAAGIGPEVIKDKLQVLGDIAAAGNVPLSDMASIFAKIKNKGKAMTEEILQMSDRGIPIIQLLSKQFGVTGDQIFDMASKGKLSFKVIEKALISMTEKGGFANNAMINQSKTLNGLISTLKDNFMLTTGAIGQEFLPEAKKIANNIIDILIKTKDWVAKNKNLIKTVVKIGLVLSGISVAVLVIGKAIAIFLAIKNALIAVKAATIAFNIAMRANPTVFVVTAIIAAIILLIKKWADMKQAGVNAWNAIAEVGQRVIDKAKEWLQSFIKPFIKVFKFLQKLKGTVFGGGGDAGAEVNNLITPAKQAGQSVDVSGQITVAAQKGSEVTGMQSYNRNVGLNAATAGAM